MKKKADGKTQKKLSRRSMEKEINILEGALKVFGEKGFDETTISAISKAAKISDATIYEYFSSKEDVLFSIPKVYTQREFERLKEIGRFIHCPKERLRAIIQAYLEFYEKNRLYTSVVMLSLKGNRNFLKSDAYKIIREASRTIVDTFNEGVQRQIFRDDLDPFLVRNMILGFIEHLTIQWLLVERPESLTQNLDQIFDMCMGAILRPDTAETLNLNCRTLNITVKE